VREGFNSDEELSLYDYLVSGQELSKEDIKKLKGLAQQMLTKIKAQIQILDRWRDKEDTRSIVSILIRDLLWEGLPESYSDAAVQAQWQTIYEYVYQAYPTV
jgi:type I restriction enzyme R subunit